MPNGQMLSQVIPGASNLFKKPHKPAARPVLPGNAKPAPRIGNGRAMWVHTRSTGRDRRYLVHLPTHYNPRRPPPVLFGFDGWRDTPENFRRYSRLHETGAAREAIRISPESINHGWEGAPYAVVHPGDTMMKYHGGYRHNGSHYLAVPVLVNSYKKRNGCVGAPRVINIPGGKRHVYPCAQGAATADQPAQSHVEPHARC